jgi:tetratricopeptide (TPR) repeat protein
MLRPHEALHLITEPSECVKLLEFVVANPSVGSVAASRELHISLRTWYGAVEKLDELELVQVERVPGGTKIRRVEITPHGRALLKLLEGLPGFFAHSPAALERELTLRASGVGPTITGETLCRLIEHAHRRGDLGALKELEVSATEAGRLGEAAFAFAMDSFLRGHLRSANTRFETALAHLEKETESRSYRRVLYQQAFALHAFGKERTAYQSFTRLRKLARDAGDLTTEGDARLGIGILKARRAQFDDAVKNLDRALDCARRAGSAYREATVLTTLCMVSFFIDQSRGLALSEDALQAAKRSGARVLLVHIHSNRAMMFAVLGRKQESLTELTLSRRLSRVVGHERGQEMLEEWAALVRRILRPRRTGNPSDWRDQALQILQKPPSQPPEEPPVSPRGRAPAQSG